MATEIINTIKTRTGSADANRAEQVKLHNRGVNIIDTGIQCLLRLITEDYLCF